MLKSPPITIGASGLEWYRLTTDCAKSELFSNTIGYALFV